MYSLLFKKENALLFSLLFLFLIHFNKELAAQYKEVPSSQIEWSLQKLSSLGSVLYIAAHPDDENTRLLSYLSREMKLRTAYLSLTRGDGGQNLIGSEQSELLGLIRTQELLAARSVDGGEQFFTRAVDFGYSKTPDETLSIWKKDEVLADVVYVIRKFRPDVIVCRFPTTGEGGHGHHTASAILALEAFDLAADPKAYPEQLKDLSIWQPKSIFWNTFNFGSRNTTSPDQIQMNVGGFNTYFGHDYGEIAAMSRSNHKSQGFGSLAQRGEVTEFFKFLKGDKPKATLFDNLNFTWTKIAGSENVVSLITALQDEFNSAHPEKSIDKLLDLHKAIHNLKIDNNDKHWLEIKKKEIEQLIMDCAGIKLEAYSEIGSVVQGQTLECKVDFLVRNSGLVKLQKLSLGGSDTDTLINRMMGKYELLSIDRKLNISGIPNDPYWLRTPASGGIYSIPDKSYTGKPINDQSLKAYCVFEIGGKSFQVEAPIRYKFRDPVRGEVNQPIEILPAVTVNPLSSVVFVKGEEAKSVKFAVKSNHGAFQGKLIIEPHAGLKTIVVNPDIKLEKSGDEVIVEVKLAIRQSSFDGMLNVRVADESNSYTMAIERIRYDHIPASFVLKKASVKVLKLDMKLAQKNLAYIEGAGDKIPDILREFGYNVSILSDEDLTSADLSGYDAIILGIRAYNTRDILATTNKRLLEYVENGGRLIVQYNTNSRVGPLKDGIGPYPFSITRNRVTDEEAKVQLTQANHSLFQFPNKITDADFEGWIQERGLYFAGDIDSNYQTFIQINDKDEEPLNGSLIMARSGKGYFIYTGLSFFRELPIGVPGACRLFVNLISQDVQK